MNQETIDLINSDAEEIMQLTFPFCEDDDMITSLRNTKINNLAYEIKESLDKLKVE